MEGPWATLFSKSAISLAASAGARFCTISAWTWAEGETVVLLGRSGSGKTTLLKTVNGLIPLSGGAIRFEGRAATEWDPIQMRRRMGYVIQDAGLFPHWTVEANVGLVPRLAGWTPERIAQRVEELLARGGTGARRVPRTLSARALGRTEAAGGDCAGAGGGSAAAAVRRTLRGARPDHAARLAAPVSGTAAHACARRRCS